jgi:CRISPR-associated protein (TIGR03986 family)
LLCRAVDNRRAAGKVEGDHLQVRFKLATEKTHPHSGGKWLAYHKVERLVPMEGAGTTYVEGVLVCTGQPGPVKHMEFVFLPFKRKADSYVVPPDVMAAFQQVHDAADGDWEQLWKGLAGKGSPVPVFFLGDQAAGAQRPVARLGLAQMFRLPGLHRLGELAGRAQAQAPADRLDFVQTLFGHVLDGLPALKGRVAISDFVPVADAPPREAAAGYRGATVLGQPRPGFYPNYLKQGSGQAPNGNGYATILSPQPPELRGWKRYPVRAEAQVHVPPPPEKSKPSVQVQLRPLAAGCRMRGTIRLHNVRPEELGAILWALDFGQPAAADGVPSLRHALGMGKPFGFGQVSLRLLGEPQVRPNDPRAAPPAVATLRRAFEDYMAAQVPNWGNSETLRELRAMADPSHPAATRANLTPPQGPKAFTEIKKAGVRAALTPYSQMGTRR